MIELERYCVTEHDAFCSAAAMIASRIMFVLLGLGLTRLTVTATALGDLLLLPGRYATANTDRVRKQNLGN